MKTFTKLALIAATTALVPFAATAKAPSLGSAAAAANGVHTIVGATPTDIQMLTVNVAGSTGNGDFDSGDPSNTIQTFNIGAGAHVTGVSYDVNITAFDPSYLSEATLAFTGSDTTGAGVFLAPGFDTPAPGTESFSSGGDVDLVSLGLDFTVGDDGILRLEYFEGFDDGSVNPDSLWNSGTVTFTYDGDVVTPPTGAVPEPATWAMMIGGFGLVGGALRRRQSTSVTFA